jgi:hypothetical protein
MLDVWGNVIWFIARASRRVQGPIQLNIHWASGALPRRVRRPGCKADRSFPSNAEIKNEWSCLHAFMAWTGTSLPFTSTSKKWRF